MSLKVKNNLANIPRPSTEFPRQFVPEDLDFSKWENIERLFQSLDDRKLSSKEDLEKFLLDSSELADVVSEEGDRRYVLMTCQTDDEEKEKAFLDFEENILPKIKPYSHSLNQKLVDSAWVSELDPDRYSILLKKVRNQLELYREENIAIETELSKLSQKYQKISGAMTIEYQGKELTMQQASVYFQDSDRNVRKEVFDLTTGRRLQDAEKLENLFDEMLKLRIKIAKNAGFDNYRDYMFRRKERFDYGPEHCFQFHDGIENIVVPLTKTATAERRKAMNIDSVKPYDVACDRYGRNPLKPFDNTDDLIFGCRDIFNQIDPELGGKFQIMIDMGLLDLDSRKGKAPGGYQETLSEIRLPFIFMNAVGLNRDVFTLLHEGGHAFHSLAARTEPLTIYRHAPMEFCEVASMSMEHLAAPYLNVFYKDAEAARAWYDHLTGDIGLLPWVAIVDAFQQWIYTHPDHTQDERAKHWVSLMERFNSGVDHSGYEEALKFSWHKQLHIFEVPFYYIEYGIALLGALQVWHNSLEDFNGAVASYKKALELGGTKRLPEIFETANIKFDFSEKTLQPLMDNVSADMERVKALER